MSCCYEPGEIVVVPKPGGTSADYESVLCSAAEWLRFNDILDGRVDGIPAPFIKKVHTGEELESAMQLVAGGSVAAALPNYYVRPAQQNTLCDGEVTLNDGAIVTALEQLNAPAPFTQDHGSGVAVLVIDSGYHPGNPGVRRLDTCDPVDAQTPASAAHGTVVTELVLRLAPRARIMSVRALGNSKTVAAVLTALYVAEVADPPDVINISFSVAGESGRCRNCGHRDRGDFTVAQLGKAFGAITAGQTRRSGPVWIAAAGNESETQTVTMPASLENVIAVGSYDASSKTVPPYAIYHEVPEARFVMAFGGMDSVAGCIATTRSVIKPRLFGTSFAAPLITGLVVRLISAARPLLPPWVQLTPFVMACLRELAVRIPNHDSRRHGLGLIRWSWPSRMPPLMLSHAPAGWIFPSSAFAPGNDLLPEDLRESLRRDAYSRWEVAGRPHGRDLEFWRAARDGLRVPEWLR